jgi:peptidoglycan hydrolase-like protein with peptidoglycan-binding domain
MNPYPYYAGYGYGNYNSGASYGSTSYGSSTAAPESVQVQSALSQQGYYQGPIDGIVGPGTQAAISAYQQNNGLRVTGTITNGLIRDLGVS